MKPASESKEQHLKNLILRVDEPLIWRVTNIVLTSDPSNDEDDLEESFVAQRDLLQDQEDSENYKFLS